MKLQCSIYTKVKNSVLIRLFLKSKVPALETLKFDIKYIMNPNSTYPSNPVDINIYDSSDLSNLIHRSRGLMNIITTVPFTVSKEYSSLESSALGAGMASTYTLKMQLRHGIKKGGGLLIRYPP